jgi:hypothetical protein
MIAPPFIHQTSSPYSITYSIRHVHISQYTYTWTLKTSECIPHNNSKNHVYAVLVVLKQILHMEKHVITNVGSTNIEASHIFSCRAVFAYANLKLAFSVPLLQPTTDYKKHPYALITLLLLACSLNYAQLFTYDTQHHAHCKNHKYVLTTTTGTI